jgi:hypothetical protein
MGDFSWSDLCDSGDEDDEDYDPFKDPTLQQPGVLQRRQRRRQQQRQQHHHRQMLEAMRR